MGPAGNQWRNEGHEGQHIRPSPAGACGPCHQETLAQGNTSPPVLRPPGPGPPGRYPTPGPVRPTAGAWGQRPVMRSWIF